MSIKPIILAATAVSVGALLAYAQNSFEGVEIKTTPVAGNIYMLEGRGGNIGVSAGPDGLLMIDSQFAPLSEKIRSALRELGAENPKFLINTHVHGDHVGGNENFGRKATILAQANVRKRMTQGDTPSAKAALPVITFRDGISVHFNGEEVRVIHFPAGHTDGDSVIIFTKSNVVHMGDDFFAGRFPYIDLDSGGDVAGYIKNVDRALEMIRDDARIIPGHGPLATREDLKNFRDMLEQTTAVIRKGMKDGKSLEQLQAAGLPDRWKSWGTGFVNTDRWISIVHRSYSK